MKVRLVILQVATKGLYLSRPTRPINACIWYTQDDTCVYWWQEAMRTNLAMMSLLRRRFVCAVHRTSFIHVCHFLLDSKLDQVLHQTYFPGRKCNCQETLAEESCGSHTAYLLSIKIHSAGMTYFNYNRGGAAVQTQPFPAIKGRIALSLYGAGIFSYNWTQKGLEKDLYWLFFRPLE